MHPNSGSLPYTLQTDRDSQKPQQRRGLGQCVRQGAASRPDSAPPSGLPTHLWVLMETRARQTTLPGEPRPCWRRSPGGSTSTAGLGVNVALALLWRPDFLLQGVTHTRHVSPMTDQPHGLTLLCPSSGETPWLSLRYPVSWAWENALSTLPAHREQMAPPLSTKMGFSTNHLQGTNSASL